MPLKSNEPITNAKPVDKQVNKTGSSNIMDDAPLFAGLDDYVLKQTASKKAVTARKSQPKEKHKTDPRATKQSPTAQSGLESTSKEHQAPFPGNPALLLSVAEMCTLLKVSRATLVRLDKSGQLPGRIKLGGSVRFHRETVETWLQSLITTRPTP
jgi:excisionase family DNA binding protein